MVAWFLNQYRLQIEFISQNIDGAQEAGVDIEHSPLFSDWLETDRNLRDTVKIYCGPENRDVIRDMLKSDGWNEQAVERLRKLK